MEKKFKVSFVITEDALKLTEGETISGMKAFLEEQEGVSEVKIEEVIPTEAVVGA